MNELNPEIRKELDAIRVIIDALDKLTDAAQSRVIRYLADRYQVAALWAG